MRYFGMKRSRAWVVQLMPFIVLGCVAVSAFSPRQVMAANPYQQAMAGLEADALEFVQAPGYGSMDPEELVDDRYYSEKIFPRDRCRPGSMSMPDADMVPVVRSILLLEAREASLPHVRYRVTYSMNASPDVPEAQHAYVEVTRYNMGPSLREELLASTPGGQVADAAQFGIGPHVSWRFVMAPTMGLRADLFFASRREIPATRAQTADCLGEPCLSLVDPSGSDLDWRVMSPPQMQRSVYVSKSASGVTGPARVMEEVWAGLVPDEMDALPYHREQPHFVIVVSSDTAGQEAMVSALAWQAQAMDDALAEVWVQRNEVAGVPAEFSIAYVERD